MFLEYARFMRSFVWSTFSQLLPVKCTYGCMVMGCCYAQPHSTADKPNPVLLSSQTVDTNLLPAYDIGAFCID